MEVTENKPGSSSIDPSVIEQAESKIKQTFRAARRRVKQIDLRQIVVDNPFAAVGIGLAAGAAVGLVRPMPKRGPVDRLLTGLVTTMVYRAIKQAAFAQLGVYAKDYLKSKNDERSAREVNVNPPF
ncbi:MAG TPA: hypothetical protein VL326_36825 [Kofleriaceae bacterium]|jgi:hypothetical protein|nr:hypothetical protein [Kofleriaceae bacterium]